MSLEKTDEGAPSGTRRRLCPQPIDETRAFIEFQLALMRDLLRMLEDGLGEVARKERSAHVPNDRLNLCTSDGIKTWGQFLHFQQVHGFELPLRIRYTFILQLYTLFEASAIALCDEVCRRKSLSRSLDDVVGERTFRGVKTYFTKVFPVRGIPWGDLETMKDIRNCLIHCGGVVRVSSHASRLKAFEKRWPAKLRILESGYLFIFRNYCEEMVRVTEKFFERAFVTGGFGQKMVQYKIGHAQELLKLLEEEDNLSQAANVNRVLGSSTATKVMK